MDGKFFAIARQRTIVLDLLRMARRVPSFPVERRFEMADVAAARVDAAVRISWIALFAKAYGLAGQQHPELRQVFVRWPWPRYYQHPASVISIAVNRPTDSGDFLGFGRIREPEHKSLREIQSELDQFCTGNIRQVFKQQWISSHLPSIIRRSGWWWRMEIAICKRAKRVGTGSISVLAGLGCNNRLHPCLLTTSLSYGPLTTDGQMDVTLQCDHRILDGVPAARALTGIEHALRTELLEELRADQRTTPRPILRSA